jgi:hypothetical protein
MQQLTRISGVENIADHGTIGPRKFFAGRKEKGKEEKRAKKEKKKERMKKKGKKKNRKKEKLHQ